MIVPILRPIHDIIRPSTFDIFLGGFQFFTSSRENKGHPVTINRVIGLQFLASTSHHITSSKEHIRVAKHPFIKVSIHRWVILFRSSPCIIPTIHHRSIRQKEPESQSQPSARSHCFWGFFFFGTRGGLVMVMVCYYSWNWSGDGMEWDAMGLN